MNPAKTMRHRYEPSVVRRTRGVDGPTFTTERCAACGHPARHRLHLVLVASR